MPPRKGAWQPYDIDRWEDGSGVYVALPGGKTTRSETAHDVVTFDFDEAGKLVGVEILATPR